MSDPRRRAPAGREPAPATASGAVTKPVRDPLTASGSGRPGSPHTLSPSFPETLL
ncbi:hypothetical protein [Streptomyces populi]|uniref:hypothetical protein n=1 Tax=Streptomyces populi TaxID=2058924 RepID=UPI0013A6DEE3|nr:hypothetical protein [Streptomyces populi]